MPSSKNDSNISSNIANTAAYIPVHGYRALKESGNILSAAIFATNGNNFGTFHYSDPNHAKSTLRHHDRELAYQDIKEDISNNIKFKPKLDGITSFNTYLDTRTNYVANIKLSDDDAQDNAIKAEIAALMRNADYTDKIKEIKNGFDQMITVNNQKSHEPDFRPLSFINQLQTMQGLINSKAILEEQLNKDLAAIKIKLQNSTPAISAEKLAEVEKQIREAHATANAALNKAVADNLSVLHAQAAPAIGQVFQALRTYKYGNAEAKKAMEEAGLVNNGPKATATGSGMKAEEPGISLQDYNHNKLKEWYTLTGRKIHVGDQKDENGNNNTFTIQLPRRTPGMGLQNDPFGGYASWITTGSLQYYTGLNDNVKSDALELAEAVKNAGFDTITTEISGKDPEHNRFLAKKYYEAALEAGFKPENIVININGVKQDALTLSEEKKGLFTQRPSRDQYAAMQQTKRDNVTNEILKQNQWVNVDVDPTAVKGAAAGSGISIAPPGGPEETITLRNKGPEEAISLQSPARHQRPLVSVSGVDYSEYKAKVALASVSGTPSSAPVAAPASPAATPQLHPLKEPEPNASPKPY